MLWSYDHTVELKLNKVFYLNYYNSRYTALTLLGIRQEVKQIMANVFIQRFKRFLFSPRSLRFFMFFNFSWNVFLHLWFQQYFRLLRHCM